MALPQLEQKIQFPSCNCDAFLSQEKKKKKGSCQPVLSFANSLSHFVTAGINICHGAKAAAPYAASFRGGYAKNISVVQLLGVVMPWTWTNGSSLLLKHPWSPLCWCKRQPEPCQGDLGLAVGLRGSWARVWVLNTAAAVLQAD